MFLTINTSTTGIELLLDDIYKYYETEKQSSFLPQITEDFLKENNKTFKDITAVAVITGPGSFTGIRLGIAFAKGLSLGLAVPIIPINAFELHFEEDENAFIKIDSGKDDFFVSSKDVLPQIMTKEEIKKVLNNRRIKDNKFNLRLANNIIKRKINNNEVVIPLYLRPSYVEKC